jgi:hypothetical protein
MGYPRESYARESGMKTAVMALVLASMVLTACGQVRNSRLNPFNWFGRSEPVQTTAVVLPGEIKDLRPLVQQVTEMVVEPIPEGAIIRAKGLPPTQGWWNAELVERSFEDGVLTFDFRIIGPRSPQPAVTPRSREVVVATSLSNIRLATVRQIVVQGETNARSSRR